jgi:hypothetical protein
MKINYKNTALGFLEDPEKMEFNLPEDSSGMTEFERLNFGHSIRSAYKENADLFKTNVRYISNPFFEAYKRAEHKLKGVILETEFEESGTLIFKAEGSKHYHTWFYVLITTVVNGEWNYKIILNVFTKHVDNDHISLDACITRDEEHSKTFLWSEWGKVPNFDVKLICDLLGLLTFLRYCELETKEIKAGRKDVHIGTKYVNETKSNIQILDSTWFTTIVKSDGFHVRGHFRFQPCGQGMKDRKLIWIADYDKEGYTRIAKVLNT